MSYYYLHINKFHPQWYVRPSPIPIPPPSIPILPTSQPLTNNQQTTPTPPTTNSALSLSVLTSLGGVIGYARTGSVPSIAAGLSVGAIYLASYYRLQGRQSYGEELGLLASVVLGGSSVPRAIKTKKMVPIGLSVVAVYGLWAFGTALRERR